MKQTLLFKKVSPLKMWWLLRSYKKCPDCGSDKIGNGEGTIEINGNHFKRTCECGFNVMKGAMEVGK